MLTPESFVLSVRRDRSAVVMASKNDGADPSPRKGEDDTFVARRSYVSSLDKKVDSSAKIGMFMIP